MERRDCEYDLFVIVEFTDRNDEKGMRTRTWPKRRKVRVSQLRVVWQISEPSIIYLFRLVGLISGTPIYTHMSNVDSSTKNDLDVAGQAKTLSWGSVRTALGDDGGGAGARRVWLRGGDTRLGYLSSKKVPKERRCAPFAFFVSDQHFLGWSNRFADEVRLLLGDQTDLPHH